MNTSIAFSRAEPEADRPDLADVLGMVQRLHAAVPDGNEWQRLALALSDAGEHVEGMDGLVLDGEVYNTRRVHIDGHPEHLYALTEETHMTTPPRAASSATASAIETVSEAIITDRFTTCACPNQDGPHTDQQALTRSHALESDAQIIARHTGRHVVPVGEIRTEVSA